MGSTRRSLLWIALGVMIVFAVCLERQFNSPFPALTTSLSSSKSSLQDFMGIMGGLRRLSADLAWIDTLAYYGTHHHHEGDEGAHFDEETVEDYPEFYSYCLRTIRIDPYFKYVYYYGSGVLGWNLNRVDEAEELLKQGIKAFPKEWRFQQYLAAMAFQKNHDINKLTEFLESFLLEPDCPNILRSILANIYKKQHRYADAVRVWLMVYETGDRDYRWKAENQLNELALFRK